MIKIGITKENDKIGDVRTPLSPKQSKEIKNKTGFNVEVQGSKIRCFSDDDYMKEGIDVVNNLNKSDFIFGIKEADEKKLIKDKTYFMFSHTIKKQPHNRGLLQKVLQKKIRLIDYECLKKEGKRIVAFGKYAGIAGAYNTLMAYGEKIKLFNLKRLSHFKNKKELYLFSKKNPVIKKIRSLIIGNGRVAKGVIELLNSFGFNNVTIEEYKKDLEKGPVYCILKTKDYIENISGNKFSKADYYKKPEKYKSNFLQLIDKTDMLINASYWDPRYPRLFEEKNVDDNFSIKVIGDITCDINGSIPLTKFASTIKKPFFDYCIKSRKIIKPFSKGKTVTMMTIDNLPSELPRDSSNYFGRILMKYLIPFLKERGNKIINGATIAEKGSLTKRYEYLRDYIS
ncbi:MAG: alanine dehydrogenase [Flammeovirgaceae bacterium]|nr:alanine dehydrogenase [Flammeovirgaceae bacterium]